MMVTIYHNPRCTKSRLTLQLLQDRNLSPQVIEYLQTPPSANELSTILKQLGISARQLLRKQEEEYKQLGLQDESKSDAQLIEAMVTHPRLIERPIVVKGDKAAIGRPPENVLAILD